MAQEELKPTPIPNVNFTAVMNLQRHEDGTPHPQLFLMVTDKESVNTLRKLFPAYKRTSDVLQKVEEKFDMPVDVATEGFKIFERIFGMADEATGMPSLHDAFSKFKTIPGQEHEGLKLYEDYDDTEEGSFLYLLSDFLYQALFSTTAYKKSMHKSLFKDYIHQPSIIKYIKEGKLEVTFVPGFKENFEPEIVEAWDKFYGGFSNMYSPDYEMYFNAIDLFDEFRNGLCKNEVSCEYDPYFEEYKEYRDNNPPDHPLHNMRFFKREPHKPQHEFPVHLVTVQNNIDDTTNPFAIPRAVYNSIPNKEKE